MIKIALPWEQTQAALKWLIQNAGTAAAKKKALAHAQTTAAKYGRIFAHKAAADAYAKAYLSKLAGNFTDMKSFNWPDAGEAAKDIATKGKNPSKALRKRIETPPENVIHPPPVLVKHPANTGETEKDLTTQNEKVDKYAGLRILANRVDTQAA